MFCILLPITQFTFHNKNTKTNSAYRFKEREEFWDFASFRGFLQLFFKNEEIRKGGGFMSSPPAEVQSLFLSLCKKGNKSEIVRVLKKEGRNILRSVDDINQTPLHIVCENGYEEIVNYFLQEKFKVDVNALDSQGWTPLHSACKSGNRNIIEALLNRGAFARALTDEKSTPLHYVVRSKIEDPAATHSIVSLLLKKGNMIDAQNNLGETPLHTACSHGRSIFVLHLMNSKANPNLQTYVLSF